MPRTQVTICGAPKAIAMPKIAPRHHPQLIRPAIAIAPSPMTRMIAIGVSQARMLVCRAVAPVIKGEAACANTRAGAEASRRNRAPRQGRRKDLARLTSMIGLRNFGGQTDCSSRVSARAVPILAATRIELIPLLLARCTEAKTLHYERVVVLLFALLVRPVAGSDLFLEHQLVTFAGVARDRLTHGTESHEPQAGHYFFSCPLFVLSRVVVPHETELREAFISLLYQLGIACEISNRSKSETVHRLCSSPRCWFGGVEAQSSEGLAIWNCVCLPVRAETRSALAVALSTIRKSCIVTPDHQEESHAIHGQHAR